MAGLRIALVVAILVNLAPCALALDVFPDEHQFGRTTASILVRVPDGGPLSVRADAPLQVAMMHADETTTKFVSTPTTFAVPTQHPDAAWHGLVGTVRLVLEREDPTRSVEVEITDGEGGGAHFTWEAAPRETPLPPMAVVGAVLGVAWAYRPWRTPPHAACAARSPSADSSKLATAAPLAGSVVTRTMPWARADRQPPSPTVRVTR